MDAADILRSAALCIGAIVAAAAVYFIITSLRGLASARREGARAGDDRRDGGTRPPR